MRVAGVWSRLRKAKRLCTQFNNDDVRMFQIRRIFFMHVNLLKCMKTLDVAEILCKFKIILNTQRDDDVEYVFWD